MSSLSNYFNNNSQTQSSAPKSYLGETPDYMVPGQIDNYLNNGSDWRDIQDIVRLCFKSLTETVRTQGIALREMEKLLQQKPSKSELNSMLNTKANLTEVTTALNNISNSLEQRPSSEEVLRLGNDKVSKNELMYYMNTKPSKEEIKTILEEKVDISEFANEINELNLKVDGVQKEVSTRLPQFAFNKDLQQLQNTLEQKADKATGNEELNSKASQDFVMKSLLKTYNKGEVDSGLKTKSDKNEILLLQSVVNKKANTEAVETGVKEVQNKIDKDAFESFVDNILKNKAELTDFKLISDAFQENKTALTKRIDDIDQDFDRLIDNIKTQFQSVNLVLTNGDQTKTDNAIVDKLGIGVNKKPDFDKIDDVVTRGKSELFDVFNSFKADITQNKTKQEEKINDKGTSITSENKNMLAKINESREAISYFVKEKEKEKVSNISLIQEVTNTLKNEIEDIKAAVSTGDDSCNKNTDTNNTIISKLGEKIDIDELEKLINSNTVEINKQISETFSKINKELSLRISKNDLAGGLGDKVNKNEINNKPSVDDYVKLKTEVSALGNEGGNKLEISNFETTGKALYERIEEIYSSLNLKANIKETVSGGKTKADIDEINKALSSIRNEMDTKNSIERFTNAMDNQAGINDALCGENCVGRWGWKSGKVKNGYAVPWEIQSVNTAPDNFIWEEERTFIYSMGEGGYELTMGIYADKKPTVQVLVNGEVVITASTSSSNIVHQSGGGRVKGSGKTTMGNITGLSLVDYLMLPENAKISVSYTGDTRAKGFIGLKKG